MGRPNLDIPVALVTGASGIDAGVVDAVPLAAGPAGTRVLAEAGWYKIAAMNTPLQWKLGATVVTSSTGGHLANGDQELIYVDADATTLSFLETTYSTAAAGGFINVVKMNLKKFDFVTPFGYDDP